MHAWESIQKAVDYIEDNIGEEIQLEELAAVANLSYFYFHRLFSRLVKKPVQEYIKLRRLACACENLKNKDKRIIDVAMEFGFGSHETFTRAFKDTYGFTPAEYRESPVPLKHFGKPDLLLGYVMVDEGVPLISNGMVLEMSRRTLEAPMHFVGVAGHMRIDGAVSKKTGIDEPGAIWGRFGNSGIKCKPDGRTVGASYYGKNTPKKCITYFAGAETACEHDYENTSHDKWQLPAGEYIVCAFEAESFDALVTDVLYKANDYAYSWRKRHGLTCGDFTAELYYKNTTDVAYMEVWVPVKEKLVDFEIKTLPKLLIVGKQIRYSWVALESGDNRLPGFWNQCISENFFAPLEAQTEHVHESAHAGVFLNWKLGGDRNFTYVVGMLMSEGAVVPEGYVAHELPAMDVAVGWYKNNFSGRGAQNLDGYKQMEKTLKANGRTNANMKWCAELYDENGDTIVRFYIPLDEKKERK